MKENTNKIDKVVDNVMNEVQGSRVVRQVKKIIISLMVGFLLLMIGVFIGMIIMQKIGLHEDNANFVGIGFGIIGFLWYFQKKDK